ncbi:MAG TPA: hypothetical protein VLA95_04990 [Gemmatimonadales bacterium]|nr:hypothetical protein [Gemmatimonadales bacterium]
MPWRLVAIGDTVWSVTPAAERGVHSALYRLVLSCRPRGGSGPSVVVPYPLESPSKAAVFAQAETIPPERIAAFLGEQLG